MIRFLFVFFAGILLPSMANAHFLFARILPPAEGGRFVEIYFSDLAEAGDPRFVEKIADTKLWLQTRPGDFRPLTLHKTSDRLRTLVPTGGTFNVAGVCTYGVLGREGKPAFLLRHYPRAVVGKLEDIQALALTREVPFEIQLKRNGAGFEFIAYHQGKPIPKAPFSALGADLKGVDFQADETGKARWQPIAPGAYSIITSRRVKETGEYAGRKFQEIREFATLTFTWPLESSGSDPAAVKLFQEAIAARGSWKDFPGFSARGKAAANGRLWEGSIRMTSTGEVEVDPDDEVVAPWVKEQMESMVLHRLPRNQEKPPVLRFADDDLHHPLGRLLIFEGGQFASSYRVKDRQILVVNRHLGKLNMTITVLENETIGAGQFLPRFYSVQFWNAETGRLERVETVQNQWFRVGRWDFPHQITVSQSGPAGLSVRTLTLHDHHLNRK